MLCKAAQVQKQTAYGTHRSYAAGLWALAVNQAESGDGSLFLPDPGNYPPCGHQLWHSPAFVPPGHFSFCDPLRHESDWLWHHRQYGVFGVYCGLWGRVWDKVLPTDFFQHTGVRFGLLLPVLAVFILGASTYITAGLGTSPYDGLPFIIASHVKRLPFKAVRMLWDIGFMAVGFLLGRDLGIVTVAVAFFLGPVITWLGKKLKRFISAHNDCALGSGSKSAGA